MEYVKDLFLTESFLVKGYVKTGGRRLTTYLNNLKSSFLEVHDATLIGIQKGDRIVTARAMICVAEILLANELIEAAGDHMMKQLAEPEKDRAVVNLSFSGKLPIEVTGKMQSKAYNRNDLGAQDFLVVTEPSIDGLGSRKSREFSVLKRAPYVIVNRRRLAYVFDYSH